MKACLVIISLFFGVSFAHAEFNPEVLTLSLESEQQEGAYEQFLNLINNDEVLNKDLSFLSNQFSNQLGVVDASLYSSDYIEKSVSISDADQITSVWGTLETYLVSVSYENTLVDKQGESNIFAQFYFISIERLYIEQCLAQDGWEEATCSTSVEVSTELLDILDLAQMLNTSVL